MIPLDVRLANFLDSVSFVSDKNIQYSVWVEGNKSVSSVISLGELYAQFFDDNDIDNFINEEISSSHLSKEEKAAIVFFRNTLRNFSKTPEKNKISDAEIVEDPEWNEIRGAATSVLKIFSKCKGDA